MKVDIVQHLQLLRWTRTKAPSPPAFDATDEYVWHLHREEPRNNIFLYAIRGPKVRHNRAFVWFPFRAHLGVGLIDGWTFVDFILSHDVEVQRSQVPS